MKLTKENVNRNNTRQQKINAQTQYSEINKILKRSIRKDKRNWINEHAKQAEEAERKGGIKELYSITRKLSQRKFRMNRPVKTTSGTFLTTQEIQLKKWEEHFSEIFNTDDNKAGGKQEMRNVKENNSKNENETEVNLDPPTKTEIKLALAQLKNGKAVGLDNINPEVLKVDPEITVEILYPLLKKIWKKEKIPEEWEEGLIIKITKKGDLANCNNWRGITLLNIASKILTRVILNRIHDTAEQHLRKEQGGFRKHRSCVDLINSLRIILEQSVEWQAILYVTFIDFEKAFDFVKREVMWLILQEYGTTRKIIQIIKILYEF
jgi:hypothetical protein